MSIHLVQLKFFVLGYVEPWFLPDYLLSKGYTKDDAALLLTIIGVASLVGRVLAGLLDPFFR